MRAALDRAIDCFDGNTSALARALGVTPHAVYQWDVAPVEQCRAIETATGGRVPREELRPDHFGGISDETNRMATSADLKVDKGAVST